MKIYVISLGCVHEGGSCVWATDSYIKAWLYVRAYRIKYENNTRDKFLWYPDQNILRSVEINYWCNRYDYVKISAYDSGVPPPVLA